MALGLVLGVLIGAISDRMGLWVVMGVIFGATLEGAARRSRPPLKP